MKRSLLLAPIAVLATLTLFTSCRKEPIIRPNPDAKWVTRGGAPITDMTPSPTAASTEHAPQ